MADPLIPPAGAPRVPTLATAPAAGRAKAEATAREFEAVFVGQMTKLMMESVAPGEFGGGHGEEMFRGVLAEQLGGQIARRGGLGIAPAVLDQIIRLQQGNKP
jgi:Rod binding domain-containing protein